MARRRRGGRRFGSKSYRKGRNKNQYVKIQRGGIRL